MTNPIFNPQPNYSGVTIQIANPAVNVGQTDGRNMQPYVNCGYYGVNGNAYPPHQPALQNQYNTYPNAYPAQYYLNNYNYPQNESGNNITEQNKTQNQNGYDTPSDVMSENVQHDGATENPAANSYKMYAQKNENKTNDMTKSENIKEDLAQREAELAEEKKNTKETKIVALTDEYIKSLENYLNNPNDEIRLMASKEVLTRLDEDKDRYDDAALNALLNKMMQDPNKLVRIAALSAFSSQLASGNDYTVNLLHNIQSNPNSDKEDVLQAADILLKMSAGVEVKNIPNPSVKDNKEQ